MSQPSTTLHLGDCLEVLRTLPDASVQTCVTSPPYYSLRDYGVAGQIGLEPTPREYVARLVDVFREVRRVLRDDGTAWVNLGDSYAANRTEQVSPTKWPSLNQGQSSKVPSGLKPKDLLGIPWSVAKALQEPYYTGSIAKIEDRIWLAAMIDGEGCMFIHRRKSGQPNGQGYFRVNDSYGAGIEVANTHEAIVRRCMEISGKGSICRQDKDRKQPLFRWNLRSNECRDVIREIYPHLVGKQHQARLLLGCPSSGPDAETAHQSMIRLHHGYSPEIDFPAPESMFTQGYYLRSDIIWQKPNPMPESVRDRPTKSHEYVFLLSKNERYYYDQDAVREEATNRACGNKDAGKYSGIALCDTKQRKHLIPAMEHRNLRSVWTITPRPFKGAHFAVMPPELVERCVKAGSKEGDTVLDPFVGSGTVAAVANALGRDAIGIDLNLDYLDMANDRVEVEHEKVSLFRAAGIA